MDQDVSHADDGGPRNLGVICLELWPQGVNGLAKDLEVMENPYLNQFVPLEFFPAAASVPLDTFDGLQDVENPLPDLPHSGTASRRTRSLMRAFKPRSVMTSTG